MIATRAAGPGDAEELVRLRRLMFRFMNGRDEPGEWERTAVESARRQLSGDAPWLVGFVVEAAGGAGLAACAVGRVEERLPAPGHPSGLFGFVFSVCTDPEYQGRGCARATTEALLKHFAERGVSRVDLHATPDAERLYRSLGFAEHSTPLSLDLRSWRGRSGAEG
ncbi:GNAT family N-acetyltransferase [Streptomyces sp. NPDC059788]|uniref:GNAT family N-acetyltransferase n=1 Tax=Streptomyces sp. NPDC059788 TaxID=3346948 RepID=UPI003665333D